MNILITEPNDYSSIALGLYSSIGRFLPSPCSVNTIDDIIKNADVLVVRLGIKFDSELLKKGRNLKYIVTPTTGLNHIDLKFCTQNDIKLVSLKGEFDFLKTITPTAELTWGLLLSLVRNIPSAFDSVLGGEWNRDLYLGTELKGKTIGIVGYGRLGKMVGVYAKSFGMTVIYNDINLVSSEIDDEYCSLDDLLLKSDVITVHLPLENATTNLLNAEKISKIKPGSVLINTSRGEVIDERSLLDALKSGRLAGAALDVLCGETSGEADWLNRNSLVEFARDHQNLLITPHIGGACPDSMRRTEEFCANKLMLALKKLPK